MKKPVVLVVLDGFGYRQSSTFNAIAQAETPHIDQWMAHYPHALLQASGTAVGLLEGAIGNSQVGHMTIGAGRIIKQPVRIMHEAIKDGTLARNAQLNKSLDSLAKSGKTLHLIGLLSDAGVHSHQELLYALINQALAHNIKKIIVHPILDGRDVTPKSAMHYLAQLQKVADEYQEVHIGSMHGRFYAMDRDNNWDRTKKSIAGLTTPGRPRFSHWHDALNYYYTHDITDETAPPTAFDNDMLITPGDGVICFNFRPDRARQLIEGLLEHFQSAPLAFLITPLPLIDNKKVIHLFEKPSITHTLMQVLSEHDKSTFAIAETEKYAHVTYFFNGGHAAPWPHETRILIPSIKTSNYALAPQMSAHQITQTVLHSLRTDPKDFYLINYANADMVGHTGNMQATIKAIAFLDTQLAHLYDQIVTKMDGTLIITADHGNAEMMFDVTTNQPHTAHTTNPVPFLVIKQSLKKEPQKLALTTLADIAPYIFHLFGITPPIAMQS